jgi:protein ImuB
MQRVACLYVPELFLQHLLQAQPQLRHRPVAVVAHTRPTAPLLGLNALARARHLQRGMPLSAAQSVVHDLVVAPSDGAQVQQSMQALWRAMLALTPGVEPDGRQLGVLWLDPQGLDGLFVSLTLWAEAVRRAAAELGFVGHVVVGFNRYLALALARMQRGCQVLADPEREAALAQAVPLAALDTTPALLAATRPVGLRTLGDLLQLQAATVRERLGAEAEHIVRMAKGLNCLPLRPKLPHVPLQISCALEPAEEDLHRLLFALKAQLAGLLAQVEQIGQVVAALTLTLTLERHAPVQLQLAAAAPSCKLMLWLDLIRLRLSAEGLPAPVSHLRCEVQAVVAQVHQVTMWDAQATKPRRDVARAAEALARLQAALGQQAVTRAQLCPSHLPEGCFVWQASCEVALPRPHWSTALLPLVRAVRTQPLLLPRRKLDAVRVCGPYRLSQAWWAKPIERDYFYVYTRQGRIAWLFHDLVRRRWWLHGEID